MLERAEFDLVMNKLRQIADVIIVDSPPIGLFPLACNCSQSRRGTFVTRYGKVSRKVAKSLLENIEETGEMYWG